MNNQVTALAQLKLELEEIESNRKDVQQGLACVRENLFTHPVVAKQSFHEARSIAEDTSRYNSAAAKLDSIISSSINKFREINIQTCGLILMAIKAARQGGKAIFCMSSPIYTASNITDGFIRRVYSVDSLLGEEVLRIYLSPFSSKPFLDSDLILFTVADDLHWEIMYDPDDSFQMDAIAAILEEANILYCQSAFFTQPLSVAPDSILRIYDFHGVVPEEAKLKGDDEEERITQINESIGVGKANIIVTVTEKMVTHISNKYPNIKARFIVMPIFDPAVVRLCNTELQNVACGSKPVVVYAGGTQAWQMIPQMQDAILSVGDKCEYHVFTPNVDAFWSLWGDRDPVATLKVCSATPDELLSEYGKCDYGFILREDILVNNVACPTKLVEYMAAGVIPIVISSRIGDFSDAGMRFISLQDFIEGKLPDEFEYRTMVESNKRAIGKLLNKFENGSNELIGAMAPRLK